MLSTDLQLMAGALLIGLIAQWITALFLKNWFKQIDFKTLHFNLTPAITPLQLLIPVLAVSLTLPLLHLSDHIRHIVEHFVQLWIMGCLGFLLTRVVQIARGALLKRYEVANNDFHARRVYTQVRIIEHILVLLIWVLTLALMIMTFSQIKEIGISIFTSAGIMGIVIGFAAQKTLGNVIAGIQIAISQPIRLEDSVLVEGEFGTIEEITLTYVVVCLWDLRRMIVPISYFIEKPFQNWTRTSTDMLGTVFFYVDYTVPMEAMRKELTNVLENSPLWGKKVNGLQISDIKEKTIEVRALMDAVDATKLWDLRCEVREKLLSFLKNKHPESLSKVRVNLSSDSNIFKNKKQGEVYEQSYSAQPHV